MRVTIPSNTEDITLEQFIKYEQLKDREGISDLEHSKRAISIFTNLPYQKIGKIKHTDYISLVNDIVTALNTPQPFKHRFELKGIEYGFTPNLNAGTMDEFMDMSEYQQGVENLPKLMAVLFRPIVKEDAFGNYKIAEYDGTRERAELFKDMPMNIVKGGVDFFLTLSQQLRRAIQKSTIAELARVQKHQSTLRSGVGMQQSTN